MKGALGKQGIAEDAAETLVNSLASAVTRLGYDVKMLIDFLGRDSCKNFLDAARVENR